MRISGTFIPVKANLDSYKIPPGGAWLAGDTFRLRQLGQAAGSYHAAQSLEQQGLPGDVTQTARILAPILLGPCEKADRFPITGPQAPRRAKTRNVWTCETAWRNYTSYHLTELACCGKGGIYTAQPPVHRMRERLVPDAACPSGLSGLQVPPVGSASWGAQWTASLQRPECAARAWQPSEARSQACGTAVIGRSGTA